MTIDDLYAVLCNTNKILAGILGCCRVQTPDGMQEYTLGKYIGAAYCVATAPDFFEVAMMDKNRVTIGISPHGPIGLQSCICVKPPTGATCGWEVLNKIEWFTVRDHGPLVWADWYSNGVDGCDVIVINRQVGPRRPSYAANWRVIQFD